MTEEHKNPYEDKKIGEHCLFTHNPITDRVFIFAVGIMIALVSVKMHSVYHERKAEREQQAIIDQKGK